MNINPLAIEKILLFSLMAKLCLGPPTPNRRAIDCQNILGKSVTNVLNLYGLLSESALQVKISAPWRDGRVVEGGGLENRFPVSRNGGSNPSPSATPFE